jgi:hypothetical protein
MQVEMKRSLLIKHILFLVFSLISNSLLSQTFQEVTGLGFTGVSYSSAKWGDYDNDGDLDVLLTGYSSPAGVTKIYCNNGNNTFTPQDNIILAQVFYSSVDWGDYDNDGDLDILLTGSTNWDATGAVSKIYHNNGNNSFTEQQGVQLPGVFHSSAAWGDYDNDGHLDFIINHRSVYFRQHLQNLS